ncbi:MAG: DoxX family protein [Planctomycetes bacterium]|nr:DoxX family protein [Planctomycetota bacterium]
MNAQPTPENPPARKPFSRYVIHAARILMGLAFFVSGTNGLFHFLPEPKPEMPAGALAFATALMNTGYMMPLIFGTQAIVGALLLANRWVPLALALIAPFILNSVAFHLFLEPGGRIPASIFLIFELGLAWAYRGSFRPMLAMKATPGP